MRNYDQNDPMRPPYTPFCHGSNDDYREYDADFIFLSLIAVMLVILVLVVAFVYFTI